ncbi:hypothetical protein AAC387_Pa05g2777 [Persea americana]
MTKPTIVSNLFLSLTLFLTTLVRTSSSTNTTTTHEILRGFSATPNPSNPSSFQPLLTDPTSTFSLGFLRVKSSELALSIIHVPSSDPVWLAQVPNSARWSESTRLLFNGSLVLSDPHSGVFWSTGTNGGDGLRLLNSSNLQIVDSVAVTVLWQSFDFPSDTLVESQNFTSAMALRNGPYSMRVGRDFLALYADFKGDSSSLYWRHKAMEAKAQVEDGLGPVYARVDSDGFLGLYQTEAAPVDVMAFASFHRGVVGLRRLRLEPDGNLRGYFWNSTIWVTEFEAIQDSCELPSSCGPYGVCRAGKGCSCLDNRTEFSGSGGCSRAESGDFCGGGEEGFWVLRRAGVEFPYKELVGFEKMGSLEECEGDCMRNCSCWGVVFSNVSGFCYRIGYPVQTLVAFGDGTKVGVFKVRKRGEKEGKGELGFGGVVGLVVVGMGVLGGLIGLGVWWWKKRMVKEGKVGFVEGDGLAPGPYRDLKESLRSESSRSLELCKR